MRLGRIVRKSEISDDCGILIEYNIPLNSRRIDFVVSGEGEWMLSYALWP